MEEITWEQLSLEKNYNIIHVDNWRETKPPTEVKTYCNKTDEFIFHFLGLSNKPDKIIICKKCSQIYRRKYGHSLEGFIAGLKVRGKLFINIGEDK